MLTRNKSMQENEMQPDFDQDVIKAPNILK